MTEAASVAASFRELRAKSEAQWHALGKDTPCVMVGTATCGRAAGALEVLKTLREEIAKAGADCPVIEVGCMGHCYAEPLVIVAKPGWPAVCYAYVNTVIAERLVKEFVLGDNPCPEFVLAALEPNDLLPSFSDFPRSGHEQKLLLKNCGVIDPTDIGSYLAAGGYKGLEKALAMTPEAVVAELKTSKLRGRGGAGFPTGLKWEMVKSAKGRTKYVICNADEGDPGAFMDRSLLESDPHAIIEGMIIAGYVVGARTGYVYVRAEYPLAVARLGIALKQAKASGLLGRNILGADFSFNISVFQGSGAFVCGEETALIASLEGSTGLPRHRPPYPPESGLHGKPTLVDNVKTLANIRHIIEKGGAWFAGIGSPESPGTAVFALAGKVVNTGLVEVPMGTTLRQIIFEVGSGIPKGKKFKAVQIGGPSGGCLPESALDLPVDFDSLKEAGAMMGSGGMVVLDEDDCMVEIARYFLEFTQRESCGKCTFCRLGTKQMLAILTDFTEGKGTLDDLANLETMAGEIKQGSLCGLGQTAPNPVLTTLHYFKDEYVEHITNGRCPALMCLHLIAYYIRRDKCERSCDACVGSCTVEAISPDKQRIKVIDQEKCVKCGICLTACPAQYNAIVKLSPPSEVPAK